MAAALDAADDLFLRTADALGRRLAADAIWSHDRCTWLGAAPLELLPGGGRANASWRTLEPDLYAGTSGVALFLAELHAATGDAACRRAARGAIRQALAQVDAVPPTARLGLYTGWPGVAFAAARVGVLLAEHALLPRAARLVRRCLAFAHDRHAFDLMAGRAGAIVALLALRPTLGDAWLVEAAARLGDELLESAEHGRAGDSWRSAGLRTQHNLTGFSHGAAGAAHALLALFAATGEDRYADAARRALRYERRWFDAAAGNWPDFRSDVAGAERGARAFSTFWCHGAPGIALSRLRAHVVLGDPAWEAEARTAIATTCAMLDAALGTGAANFSLCHGLAGNADIVLEASRALAPADADWRELCCRVARHGIDRYGGGAAPWPCGTHTGETPNLMLGLAGIGYFYLRLGRAATPSVLLLP